VAAGCLPESVLSDKDPFPLAKEAVAEAVADVVAAAPAAGGKGKPAESAAKRRRALAVIFAQPKDSVPMLEKAYAAARDADARLAYAHILGMMGDRTGADALLAKVRAAREFDKGWNYTGMGQYGMSISPLDSYIIALGRTRDPRAGDAVLEKVALLDATKEFSHHRACAMALETLGDPRAGRPLAELLAKPGMAGYATTTIEAAQAQTGPSATETAPRNNSLRELVLARALFRCGDSGGVGQRILEAYARDLRGHYARHAQAVLAETGD
jgi:HEAT repeat protein